MKRESFFVYKGKTFTYRDGWNYRCAYSEGGRYKMPRWSANREEFFIGFYSANAAYATEIANSIRDNRNPVYPVAI
jgi:hypothetical protein